MGDNTGIEWTDATWNPVTGCTKVSQGCKHCYAERIWRRPYPDRDFTDVRCHPERLGQPMRWSKPRRIFVNSMSDLFHEAVPFEFIAAIFAIMGVTTRHTYQILTKRPERMLAFFRWCADESEDWMKPPTGDNWRDQPDAMFLKHGPYLSGDGPYNNLLPWKGYDNCGPVYPYENVWLGVSVEDQNTADERIPLLLRTPAARRWVSAEPLLGPVNLKLLHLGDLMWLNAFTGVPWIFARRVCRHDGGMAEPGEFGTLDWVVAGGESGPKARPTHPAHFRYLRYQCVENGIPFLFKQWGEWAPVSDVEGPGEHFHFSNGSTMRRVGKKRAGRTLDGEIWDQSPT